MSRVLAVETGGHEFKAQDLCQNRQNCVDAWLSQENWEWDWDRYVK